MSSNGLSETENIRKNRKPGQLFRSDTENTFMLVHPLLLCGRYRLNCRPGPFFSDAFLRVFLRGNI